MVMSQGEYGVNDSISLNTVSVGMQDLHPTRYLLPYLLLP